MSSTTRFSAFKNDKDPPRKKKKKNLLPITESTSSISLLPYDLLLNCLARVSRLYYPTLSFVSKNFRSIIASPEVYKTRSLLHCIERCLYLCVRFTNDPITYWYTLFRKPNRTRSNRLNTNQFVKIPSPHIPPAQSSSVVAVGSNIYGIGGKSSSSSEVSVLDCTSHTWHQAPSMRVERNSSCTASLVDGKIYVAGGCEDVNSLNWIEVFDTKTQTWGSMTNPRREKRNGRVLKTFEGKIYLFWNDQFEVYNPKEGRWTPIRVDRDMALAINSCYAVIDNVLLATCNGKLKWHDSKVKKWKTLNGVGLPFHRHHRLFKMVDLGGKMAVLWDEKQAERWQIWCARLRLKGGAVKMRFWGRLSGLMLFLYSMIHVTCWMQMLFLRFFDEMIN